jgi:hypothetical protein
MFQGPDPNSYVGLHASLNMVALAGMNPYTTTKLVPLGAHSKSWMGPSLLSGTLPSCEPSVRRKCRLVSP